MGCGTADGAWGWRRSSEEGEKNDVKKKRQRKGGGLRNKDGVISVKANQGEQMEER